jgi:hypothetical protein
VLDLETSAVRRSRPDFGCTATKKKKERKKKEEEKREGKKHHINLKALIDVGVPH